MNAERSTIETFETHAVACRLCEGPIRLARRGDGSIESYPERFVVWCPDCNAQGLYLKAEIVELPQAQ